MFVDVVFDVVSLWSSFSVCFGTYLGALEKGVSMRVLVVVALALCAFSSQVQAASPKGETQEGKAEAEFKSEQGDLSQQLGINDIPTAGCTCGPVALSIAPINRRRSRHRARHPADRPRFATSLGIADGNRFVGER